MSFEKSKMALFHLLKPVACLPEIEWNYNFQSVKSSWLKALRCHQKKATTGVLSQLNWKLRAKLALRAGIHQNKPIPILSVFPILFTNLP